MIDIGYTQSEYDSCVYNKKLSNGFYIYLLLYVDDMLIACKYQTKINKEMTVRSRGLGIIKNGGG